jgi:penicillin-binding protein 2
MSSRDAEAGGNVSSEPPRMRVAAVGIVVFSLFAALFARLYYLQILDARTLEEVRGSQLFRTVSYEGERGRILDRNGKVLVDSRESIVITIDRRRYEEIPSDAQRQDLLVRLSGALNEAGVPVKVSDIQARLVDKRYDPFKPVPIAEDVSPELEIYLLERADEFPAVDAVRTSVRRYPMGPVASHILGYVGALSADELEAKKGAAKAYDPGDEIGKTGIERIYEDDLRGTPGKRLIEVDARNVEMGTKAEVAPTPGDDVQLTIEADLQRGVEQLLSNALVEARQRPKRKPTDPDSKAPAGAVVVLDVTTGEVLAMASYPTYDPADFVGGISASRFAELNDPAAHAPLNDRAVSSTYSPGSTFKPFTAYAALTKGAITPDDVYLDKGFYEIESCQSQGAAGCEFDNANRAAYGKVDLRRALTVSSDAYFYRLGEVFWNNQAAFGPTPIQDSAKLFGLGSATGIQLPSDGVGAVPDPDSRLRRSQENPQAFPNKDWFTGDNVNLAIGQGELLVTPLQLANAYATLANGGTEFSPSVTRGVIDRRTGQMTRAVAPRVRATVPLPPEVRQPIVDGLTRVVSDEEGTASKAFAGFPLDRFPVAGKTGTAEVDGKADTALFAAFGPANQPKYAVLAVLEESGFGADAAVPLVRQVFEQIQNPSRPVAPVPDSGAPPSDATNSAPSTATNAAGSTATSEDQGSDTFSGGEADTVTEDAPSASTAGDAATTTSTEPTPTAAPTTSTPPTSVAPPSTAPPTSPSTSPATTEPASSGGAGQDSSSTSLGPSSATAAPAAGVTSAAPSEGVPPNRSGP